MTIHYKKSLLFSLLSVALVVSGCGKKQEEYNPNRIKVGVIQGAENIVAETAKKVAKEKYNLDVELIQFNDYVIPNAALNSKEIDANAFQHKPFLENQVKERGYKIVPVANTFIYPLAGYSQKITSIDKLPEGSTITIPNDPVNRGRALLLLEKHNLVALSSNKGLIPTPLDITGNTKKLKIVELEAPQLNQSLKDRSVYLAIINTTYASQINLSPTDDGLLIEDKESPYVNVIATREENRNAENVKTFIKAYQSEEVYQEARKQFKGGVVKGW